MNFNQKDGPGVECEGEMLTRTGGRGTVDIVYTRVRQKKETTTKLSKKLLNPIKGC